jgi:iron complex outermembrane receptor protein
MKRIHHAHPAGCRGTISSLLPVALAALAAVGTSQAQEQAPAAETGAAGGLQEVVVTATRRQENLSKVPISVMALTEEALDLRGIKDFSEIARFTPGVSFDTSGTNNISIRGIAGTGGAGTTGIYIDETPIQMRALAFNPDEALPKSFDIARVEVLRGPQGTLFGAGSEGGTVRYITEQPSLTRMTMYARGEVSTTDNGAPSYEGGFAIGGPLIDNTLGARITLWYRRDGGWIDDINPVTLAPVQSNANYVDNYLARLAFLWAPSDKWSFTPAIYYQNSQRNDINNFWPLYSDPSAGKFIDADPTLRRVPDKFYLASLKVQGDFGWAQFISNTSYYDRTNQDGYEGTLYNLGFYQIYAFPPASLPAVPTAANPAYPSAVPGPATYPLIDGNGIHLPPGATNYTSPSTVDNGQINITQEFRLQSSDPSARLVWTAGLFFSENRQSYLEQIHDPMLSQLQNALIGDPNIVDVFGVGYDPAFPTDSYFLQTHAKDEQYAAFGEFTFAITEQFKFTAGARVSKNKYSFNTFTGGPQLFGPSATGSGGTSENSFTPKVSIQYQADSNNMYYFTYAKGFRPGGANNPLPYVACAQDFQNFGIANAPTTYNSDTVNSFEIGAKNNINNRIRIASSIYYVKWNNIQQVVVPPICEISFISNLGQAVSKGIDLELQASITNSLLFNLAAGYNSARYTQDSRLSPTQTAPIVADGNAIVGQTAESGYGQATTPVTVAAGLEYQFNLFSHQSFLRVDYTYEGRAKWPTAAQDPNTLQYDPNNYVLPGTTFTTLRGGMQLGSVSLSAFCDNLTNSHAITAYNWSINPNYTFDPPADYSRLQRQYTFRPRTIGITAIYRY